MIYIIKGKQIYLQGLSFPSANFVHFNNLVYELLLFLSTQTTLPSTIHLNDLLEECQIRTEHMVHNFRYRYLEIVNEMEDLAI